MRRRLPPAACRPYAPLPTRRTCLVGLLGLAAFGLPLEAHSTPPPSRLQNRLDLWLNFGRRTQNLVARAEVRRRSALLSSPLVVTGTLFVRAPHEVLLRDDDLAGSSTWIHDGVVEVVSHRKEAPRAAPTQGDATANWLAHHLCMLFAPPPDLDLDLAATARVSVPPGAGYRLELSPPRGSVARKGIRTLGVHLDPTAGAILEVVITEAQGDVWSLRLTDHRQNVDPADLDTAFAELQRPAAPSP